MWIRPGEQVKPFSSDYYDAPRQAEVWWKSYACPDLAEEKQFQFDRIKSRLRFDFLFSPAISFGRGDVLDGAYFQQTRPRVIREWLAVDDEASSPIVVRTKSGSLERDLLGWVKPEGTTRLHDELWLLIPPNLREVYHKEFRKLNPSLIVNAATLASAIGDVVGDKNVGDRLSEHWQRWIEEEHLLDVKTVDWSAPDYRTALGSFRGQDVLVEDPSTLSFYNKIVDDFCEGRSSRGDFFRQLQENLPAMLVPVNAKIAHVRAAVDKTQHETITNTPLDTNWRTWILHGVTVDSDIHPNTTIDVTIPDLLAYWLVHCDYQELLTKIYRQRAKWFEKNNEPSFRHLADAITDVMESAGSEALPKPSKAVDRIVRCLAFGAGTTWTLVRLLASGLQNFDGFDFIPAFIGAVSGLSQKTSKYVDRTVKSLSKGLVAAQLIQTFRRRGIQDQNETVPDKANSADAKSRVAD